MEDADQDAFQDADVSMVVDYTRIATVVVARKLFQVALQKACAFAQGQPRQACASQARELLYRLALQTGRMLREPRFLSRKGPQVATNHSCDHPTVEQDFFCCFALQWLLAYASAV